MQKPCQYLTPYQQIEYYNRKSTWRLVYRLETKWPGMSLWDMWVWLGGGVSHQNRSKTTTGGLLLLGILLGGCSRIPTEVWLPCAVLEAPDYCSGSRPGVDVLPVERYAVLINLSTPTPPQPIQ